MSYSSAQIPIKQILVIRYKEIGDVLLSSVVCNTVRKSFPEAAIDYLMYDVTADLFYDHPSVDNVISITREERESNFKYLKKTWAIAKNDYDLIIDTTSTYRTALISFFSYKAPIRIGRSKKGQGIFYTHHFDLEKIRSQSPEGTPKVIERLAMLEPLAAMGYQLNGDRQMVLNVPIKVRNAMGAVMVRSGINFNRPIFIFSVSSKYDHKSWRVDYMQEVVKFCMETYGAQIILYAGSIKERNDIKEFHELMGSHKDIHCDIKTPTLLNLAAIMTHCDMFIGNEGGPRHMSQALGLPSVAVFSPSTVKSEWLPNKSRKYQGVECSDVIEVSEEDKARMVLEENFNTDDYSELYKQINPESVIPCIQDVISFVGLDRSIEFRNFENQ